LVPGTDGFERDFTAELN